MSKNAFASVAPAGFSFAGGLYVLSKLETLLDRGPYPFIFMDRTV
jgi:hypothetical protein